MPILEVGDDGVLRVPGVEPHAKFELDLIGEVIVLRPANETRPFWQRATPEGRAEAFERWATTSPSDTPDVPDECLRREGIYD